MEAFDLAYKRADSLLSPAQHPPDVFDSRYCGAHTHGQGGKMYKESVTVCARFTDRHRLLLDSACLHSALLRHRNHPLWVLPVTSAFFFWSSQRKKKSFFVFLFVSQVHFFLPIVSRPSAHLFYRRSFAPRVRKLIRRAFIFKLHTLQYSQSSRRALRPRRDQTYIHLPTKRSIL